MLVGDREVLRHEGGWAIGKVAVALIVAMFWVVESRYGDAWLVPWHDEVVIARLAQNWARGRGFCNDLLEGVLTGAERRTYWQMPVYPMALRVWGAIFGFDLTALRRISRLLGACCLFLTFALLKRWGVSPLWGVVAALWVASDLNFQFAANFIRPEVLCVTLLLLTAFLSFPSRADPSHPTLCQTWVSGTAAAVAVMTHPIALLPLLVVIAVAYRRTGWRGAMAASFPSLLAAALWLLYAAGDWATFVAQLKAHWLHKERSLTDYLLDGLGATFWGFHTYLGVPLNAFPVLSVVVVSVLATIRGHWSVPKGFLVFAVVLYGAVTLGGEAAYPALFVPFASLLAASLFEALGKGNVGWRKALVAAAFLWWGYQASIVARHLAAVPRIRRELHAFYAELHRSLPLGARLLVGSFSPDPTFYLLRFRPDVRVYGLMPWPMVDKKAFRRLCRRLTHALLIGEVRWRGGARLREWHFTWGGLAKGARGATIVLWRCRPP